MLNNIFIFILSLFLVIKGATLATKYSEKIASGFKLSKYVVGFIVVSIISILPEAFIAINSAISGMPSFGLSTLFGSNIADLSLVFAILIITAGRGIKIESKIIKNNRMYPFFLLLPLVLGLDGLYSRVDGIALMLAGIIFYYLSFKKDKSFEIEKVKDKDRFKNFLWLIFSMALLLVGAHFIVESAKVLASGLGISPLLIGMLVVGLGTTIPELFFSYKSIKNQDDDTAVGDILGTVLADATIVVGLLAFINPFVFPQRIIYITGLFMVLSSIILFRFMKSGNKLSKREGYLLLFYWVIVVLIEFIIGT